MWNLYIKSWCHMSRTVTLHPARRGACQRGTCQRRTPTTCHSPPAHKALQPRRFSPITSGGYVDVFYVL